jgi:tRNA (Thr-GGU) A37 N-methylase
LVAEDTVAAETTGRHAIRPIGRVESPLTDRESAPKQGFEGAPDAWLAFDPDVAEGIRGTPIVDVKPVLAGGGEAAVR